MQEFSARILERLTIDAKPAVILDRTAFYPTSGGQPHDTGRLGSARVLRVELDSSGAVVHLLDSNPSGETLPGAIDWDRRFDHMQQHTGQHILSRAFLRLTKAETLSFHMGAAECSIDVDLPEGSEPLMREVEALASRVVFEDRPVRTLTGTRKDFEAFKLDDAIGKGEVRIIEVTDFDSSPCGGTHVRRSGEVGAIGVLGFERYKGGLRVHFCCGGRVLTILTQYRTVLDQLRSAFSAGLDELPQLSQKCIHDKAALSRENHRLQEALVEHESRELIRQAGAQSTGAVIVRQYRDRTLEHLKSLAKHIASHDEAVAILGLKTDPAQAVLARGKNVAVNCQVALKKVSSVHGGCGGGREDFAQAGGIPGDNLDPWLRAAEKHFKSS